MLRRKRTGEGMSGQDTTKENAGPAAADQTPQGPHSSLTGRSSLMDDALLMLRNPSAVADVPDVGADDKPTPQARHRARAAALALGLIFLCVVGVEWIDAGMRAALRSGFFFIAFLVFAVVVGGISALFAKFSQRLGVAVCVFIFCAAFFGFIWWVMANWGR